MRRADPLGPRTLPDWNADAAASLLPQTLRWLATLEVQVRPRNLSDAYPRIANELAALWDRPDRFGAYVGRLLASCRRPRSGVRIKVARELHMLRAYHMSVYPDASDGAGPELPK